MLFSTAFIVLFLNFLQLSHTLADTTDTAVIESIAHTGNGCSGDSLNCKLSEDGGVFSIKYRALAATLDTDPQTECQIQVVLSVPTTQHFRILSSRHQGFAYFLNGTKAKLEASVRFKGQGPGINFVSQFFSPLKKDFRTLDTVPADPSIWSSANCQQSKATFTVVTKISIDAGGHTSDDAIAQILPSEGSGAIEQSFQLGWENCPPVSS